MEKELDKKAELIERKLELESLISSNRKSILDRFQTIDFLGMQKLIDSTSEAVRLVNKIDKDLKKL